MEVISVQQFLRVLSESVPEKVRTLVIEEVLDDCTKYEVDGELLEALKVLKRYFNEVDWYDYSRRSKKTDRIKY